MELLSSFSLFSSLPLEIRNDIWDLTLPGPRVIRVIPNPRWATDYVRYITKPASWGRHHPVALSVNRESRQEALRCLKPMFNCYWNVRIDILYIESDPDVRKSSRNSPWTQYELLCDLQDEEVLGGITSIALDWALWRRWDRWDPRMLDDCVNKLRCMRGIKNCFFVYATSQEKDNASVTPLTLRKISSSDETRLAGWIDFARCVDCIMAKDKRAHREEWEKRLAPLNISYVGMRHGGE